MSKFIRPDIDEYFLKIASVVAERSTCRRHHVGAVAVRDKHILTTGYNGAPAGLKDCLELGCLRDEMQIPSGTRHEICRGVHAEQNAIIRGDPLRMAGGTMYVNAKPCNICAKMIINAGIKRVVYVEFYPDNEGVELIRKAGIETKVFTGK